jgi:hypothetical protein
VNLIDPWGLSAADVGAITNIFNNTVGNMTSGGQRTSPGWWNNFNQSAYNATGGMAGHNYQGCYQQANTVQNNLSNQKYDDSWTFNQVGSNGPHSEPQSPLGYNLFPHWWLEGHSSNPNDPTLIIDPYNNIIRPK